MKKFKRYKLLTSLAAVAIILGATALSLFQNKKTTYSVNAASSDMVLRYNFYVPISIGLEDIDYLDNGIMYSALAPLYLTIGLYEDNTVKVSISNYSSFAGENFATELTSMLSPVTTSVNFDDRKYNIPYSNGRYGIYFDSLAVGSGFNVTNFKNVRSFRAVPYVEGDVGSYIIVHFCDSNLESLTYFRMNFYSYDGNVNVLTHNSSNTIYFPIAPTVGAASGSDYDLGMSYGYEKGKKDGYTEGKKDGIKEGKNAGYSEGKKDGIEEGKKLGMSEAETYSLPNLIWQILDAPFVMLNNIFNFDIFGINIAKAIKVVISLLIVGVVVKALL